MAILSYAKYPGSLLYTKIYVSHDTSLECCHIFQARKVAFQNVSQYSMNILATAFRSPS